jgi:chemotaxis signal transduction protein
VAEDSAAKSGAGARHRQLESAALAVETGRGVHHLSLEQIETLSDDLAIAAVPDPNPIFLGVAIHRSRAIPVLRLDLLCGEPPSPEMPGVFVVTSTKRRSFAIAVRRIRGLSLASDRRLSLPELLAPFLVAEPDNIAAETPTDQAAVQPRTRYLLVEIAGQACAFRLEDIDRVQSECRVIPVPPHRMRTGGLTTIGDLVLPLLDAAAVLGLDGKNVKPGGYVVAADPDLGSFVVPVDRLLRIAAIADSGVMHMEAGTGLAAMVEHEGREHWLLSASQLVERAGWRRYAA